MGINKQVKVSGRSGGMKQPMPPMKGPSRPAPIARARGIATATRASGKTPGTPHFTSQVSSMRSPAKAKPRGKR